ncbi:hypothetical protein [Kutzneria sp. CA-103260]|uniref:hypothetical protein n=1 Tax=Kutzneria sp. CA-103260 TaxID=2802641 RepID=UPI001BA9E0F7|nr:hypothetical protein [Kutzneria sp. CA-103260]QUQ64595.1 hypothetical protein JJ691_23150 [Kutzneria sp. CA-103260]
MTVDGSNHGILSTGAHAINIQLGNAPVRSQYLRQVRRIVPAELHGRESELAALTAFCTAAQGGYTWWRAEAWSGKSALMSWFVLNPPPGVRIVSFFITARLAAQNDRGAFVENVLEQLLALLGEPMPPFLSAATREAHLLARLADAAEACRERRERLVLLVDGLDEDRGSDEHSIAALLPIDLPAGLRVIVAGRPNPPIPDDVPPHHPLRTRAIIRPLTPSTQAQVIRAEMMKDLKHLLHGTKSEQDLLGFVTAAGGGLSVADLAELTGLLAWEIEDRLRTVSGRSFSVRPATLVADGPGVVLLGHEELQGQAVTLLGPERLAGYRDGLHAWAQRYRSRQWPTETPEYLLRGYFRMLTTIDDLPAMIACATDPRRQDRMIDLSGGDALALAEIAATMAVIAARDAPDLVVLTRLGVHRDHLRDRNADVTAELPAAWAALGRFDRAESIAESITNSDVQAEAFARVAHARVEAGHYSRAVELLGRAEPAIGDSFGEVVEAAMAPALAMLGDAERACTLAGSIGAFHDRAVIIRKVTAVVASAAADRAEVMAQSFDSLYDQCMALTAVAAAFGASGETGRLADIVERVRDLVRTEALDNPGMEVDVLAAMAVELAETGTMAHVEDLLRDAERILDELDYDHLRRPLAEAWTTVGDLNRASVLACGIADEYDRTKALVTLACGLAAAGRAGQAVEVLDHALEVAHSVEDGIDTEALALVAEGFVEIGDANRGVRVALSIEGARESGRALARLGEILASAGERETAASVLVFADRIARVRTGHHSHCGALVTAAERLAGRGDVDRVLVVLNLIEDMVRTSMPDEDTLSVRWAAGVAALCGDMDRADRIIALLADQEARVGVWVSIATRLAEAGCGPQVVDALRRAGPFVSWVGASRWRRSEPASIVRGLATAGYLETAEAIARSVPGPDLQADLLATAARAAAQSADADRAAEITGWIEQIVHETAQTLGPRRPDEALVEVLALTGDVGLAEAITRSDHDDRRRGYSWEALARAAATTGDPVRAKRILNSGNVEWHGDAPVRVAAAAAAAGYADDAVEIADAITKPYFRAKALLHMTRAMANAGDTVGAERTADMITDEEHRAQALLAVLRARPTPADPRDVAEVLLLTYWQSALPEVLASAPDALEEILAEVDVVYGKHVDGREGLEWK